MKDITARVLVNEKITENINILTLDAADLASSFLPGQFLEILTSLQSVPLLRRPYSIHWVEANRIQIMNKVVGVGSSLLYHANPMDSFQLIGPLGNTFGYKTNDFDFAFMVSGGIGVAPMAYLQLALSKQNVPFVNLVGGRTKTDIVLNHLENINVATEDGSMGFRGNVVSLFETMLPDFRNGKVKVFSCGPNTMLSALNTFCQTRDVACEVSIESVMGCGIGICYGCPVIIALPNGQTTMKLLCKDGSVFQGKDVAFDHEMDIYK